MASSKPPQARRPLAWLFILAAGVPCLLFLIFCGVAINEWWLISSNQIAVIPRPVRGMTTSVRNVPASALLPLIFGSGLLAATFGYALLRGSRKALACAYLAVGLIAGAAFVRPIL